jgi:hypothetical protein
MKIIMKLKKLVLRRSHKDTLFCRLFSEKENALSLYNATNGTDYQNPDEMSIVTINDVIYLHQKNDVSVLFDSRLTLWEHQSTLNRNMPLRGLMYYARNMEGILDDDQRRLLYGRSIVKIPTPEYYVIYNGSEKAPEKEDLKLSEAFEVPAEGYEWTAHFININAGNNSTILDRCPVLKGYAFFIDEIRRNRERGMDELEAVEKAIQTTIEAGYLVDYLKKINAEAKAMILTEFDEKGYEQTIREEGYADGKKAGREEGREEERRNTEAERKRADKAEAKLARYEAIYGALPQDANR